MVKRINGHVLLSFNTTTTVGGLCTPRDDGATQHHHTSVSYSSKVCLMTKIMLVADICRILMSSFGDCILSDLVCHKGRLEPTNLDDTLQVRFN